MSKLTRIETTNRVYGMLEQDGICGLVIEYPASIIAEIMGCSITAAAVMTGDEIVPDCDGVTLYNYINVHNIAGIVVNDGSIID